jgi:hypothetical protein
VVGSAGAGRRWGEQGGWRWCPEKGKAAWLASPEYGSAVAAVYMGRWGREEGWALLTNDIFVFLIGLTSGVRSTSANICLFATSALTGGPEM